MTELRWYMYIGWDHENRGSLSQQAWSIKDPHWSKVVGTEQLNSFGSPSSACNGAVLVWAKYVQAGRNTQHSKLRLIFYIPLALDGYVQSPGQGNRSFFLSLITLNWFSPTNNLMLFLDTVRHPQKFIIYLTTIFDIHVEFTWIWIYTRI